MESARRLSWRAPSCIKPTALKLSRLERTVPRPMRRKVADQVLIQLIEANVDIGFALVDEARAYHASGQSEIASRALQEAVDVVADIERRLQNLSDSESDPFRPLIAELRSEMAEVEREGN